MNKNNATNIVTNPFLHWKSIFTTEDGVKLIQGNKLGVKQDDLVLINFNPFMKDAALLLNVIQLFLTTPQKLLSKLYPQMRQNFALSGLS